MGVDYLNQTDTIRQLIKLFPAARNMFFGLCFSVIAAAFFLRGFAQTDRIGSLLDRVIGWGAAAVAAALFVRGLWSLLVIRQQERAPKRALTDGTHGKAKFEGPNEAIRRMSGQ